MRLLLRVWLFTLLLNSLAFSCSCVPSGVCPGLGGRRGPVFLGTVLAVTDLPRTDGTVFLSGRRVRIQVDESFGGIPPDKKEVDVLTGMGGGDCGVPFKAGEQYLVDASVGSDGLAHAGICSSTRRIEVAGAALRVLRQRRDRQHVPSLVGQIARIDRNFDGTLGTHAPKPLANMLVRVKTEGRTYEAQADAAGLYAFSDLPSGKYEFVPDLPAGATLSWYIGSDDPLIPFQLNAGACQERDVDVFASGSIQGRVFDSSNKLVPHAFVYIVPADEKVLPKERQLYWVSQGKEPFFRFVHIPPGRYLIVVNPDDSRNLDFPYRRTFYPNTPERGSAGVVILREGEQINGVDIRLGQQLAQRNLKVRVTWADGQVIRDFVFVTAKGTANPTATSEGRQADLERSFIELSVLPEEPYEIEAELTCRYADARSQGPGATFKSNKAYLTPADDQTELLLTMPGTGCPEIAGKKILTNR